jgi:hypothetical protein
LEIADMKLRFSLLLFGAGILLIGLLAFGYQVLTATSGAAATPTTFYPTTPTSNEVAIAGVSEQQYKRVELSDIKYNASTTTDTYVVTTGTVAGIKVSPYYQLILRDANGYYVVVTVDHASESVFGPIFSRLNIGDTVEVKGTAGTIQGTFTTGSSGVEFSVDGEQNIPSYGMIGITGIEKTS